MGLLTVGTPLSWEETKRHADHVRHHGITQLLKLYHRFKGRVDEECYFGDEVEYTLVTFDNKNKTVKVTLKSPLYLEKLKKMQRKDGSWSPEFASYMIEGMPARPYGPLNGGFDKVEDNMRRRRQQVLSVLGEAGESVLSMSVFPRLGCPGFTAPEFPPQPETSVSRSLFYPQEAINSTHSRTTITTSNIVQRRGEKLAINVPIFQDTNTPNPFVEEFPPCSDHQAIPGHIHMDCVGFGMGCSCLQVTFQARDITEARHLYDQLTPLTPVLMALSAASPIYRGYLADIDHRWSVLVSSVDDRTREERGHDPLKNDKFVIGKSRYASISSYLSPEGSDYNDIPLAYDQEICQRLVDGGMDQQLAEHFAHLFIRDPLHLYHEKIHPADDDDTDHFESIQGTNWQTMRFKPPPPNSDIGWRVEFRPMDCQLTDFENAALTVFVVMLTRVILSYNLNLLMPISKVDENIRRAQRRDAVLNEKFYFRQHLTSDPAPSKPGHVTENGGAMDGTLRPDNSEILELSVGEIVNGKSGVFAGLMPYMRDYIRNMDVDSSTRRTLNRYMEFISQRASGELKTTARFMRQLVSAHPSYKRDSVVTEEIAYDLLKKCDQISKGLVKCPDLVPEVTVAKAKPEKISFTQPLNGAARNIHQAA